MTPRGRGDGMHERATAMSRSVHPGVTVRARTAAASWTRRCARGPLVILVAVLLCSVIYACLAAGEQELPLVTERNTVETIIADMTLPHEGVPHGVPATWDWAQRPVINMGNAPGAFTAMTSWGQLYEAREGNPAGNTRVQLRNIRAYQLSTRDGHWHLLQRSVPVEGEAYREDFADDTHTPAQIRNETDGGISVKAGGGYNFHFWPSTGRVAIDPTDIDGIFTTCQARLIVDNPALPDDRATARYVLNMGGDYWRSLTACWLPDQRNNDDIGMGRFKRVTTQWQAFNMCTVPEAQLRRNPPPLE